MQHGFEESGDVQDIRLVVDTIPTLAWSARPDGSAEFFQKRVRELFDRSITQKTDFDADYRIVLPDGAIKYLHSIGHPSLNESGNLVAFGGTIIDMRVNGPRCWCMIATTKTSGSSSIVKTQFIHQPSACAAAVPVQQFRHGVVATAHSDVQRRPAIGVFLIDFGLVG